MTRPSIGRGLLTALMAGGAILCLAGIPTTKGWAVIPDQSRAPTEESRVKLSDDAKALGLYDAEGFFAEVDRTSHRLVIRLMLPAAMISAILGQDMTLPFAMAAAKRAAVKHRLVDYFRKRLQVEINQDHQRLELAAGASFLGGYGSIGPDQAAVSSLRIEFRAPLTAKLWRLRIEDLPNGFNEMPTKIRDLTYSGYMVFSAKDRQYDGFVPTTSPDKPNGQDHDEVEFKNRST